MKKFIHQLFAFLMVLVMLFDAAPVAVLAEDEDMQPAAEVTALAEEGTSQPAAKASDPAEDGSAAEEGTQVSGVVQLNVEKENYYRLSADQYIVTPIGENDTKSFDRFLDPNYVPGSASQPEETRGLNGEGDSASTAGDTQESQQTLALQSSAVMSPKMSKRSMGLLQSKGALGSDQTVSTKGVETESVNSLGLTSTSDGDSGAEPKRSSDTAEEPKASTGSEIQQVTGLVAYEIELNDGVPFAEEYDYQVKIPVGVNMLAGKEVSGKTIKMIGSGSYRLFHLHTNENGTIKEEEITTVSVNQKDGTITDFSFTVKQFSTFVLVYTVDYQYTDNEAAVTLNFKDFEPYSEENASRVFKYDTEECVVRATVEDVLKVAQAEGVAADSTAQNFEINFEAITASSAEGGVALAEDGSLVISADGTITLTDGVKTLTVTVQGITKLSEAILEAEGVKIQVEEGKVPLGSAAQYTSNTAERTAQLVEDNGLTAPAGEESGFASADLKIVRKNNNNEEIPAKGLFKVTLAKSSLIPEGMMLDQLYHIHSATDENGETVIQADPLAVTETEDSFVFEVENFSDIVASYTLTKMFTASDGNTYEIKVEYGADAEIPADAALSVAEITKEHETYAEYLAQALEALGGAEPAEDQFARFFDITIMNGEEKVQPKASVTVSIKLADAPEGEALKVVHFDDVDGLVVMQAETVASETESASVVDVQFETQSFSVYGVIYYLHEYPNATDLDGRSFTIRRTGTNSYATSTWASNDGRRMIGISGADNASTWYFESAGQPGQYYISTTGRSYNQDGKKVYLHMESSDNNNAAVCVYEGQVNSEWDRLPMALTVTKDGNNYYISYTSDQGITYYLNDYQNGGTAFAGWVQGPGNAGSALSFEPQDPVVQSGEQYVVLVKYNNEYYVVENDGRLTHTIYDPDTNTVTMENPMLWTVEGTNPTRHIYFNTEATGFYDNQLASGFYRRYIDPSVSNAITEENASNVTLQNVGAPWQDDEGWHQPTTVGDRSTILTQTNIDSYNNNLFTNPWDSNRYIGVVVENGVPVRICGQKPANEGVEIFFAKPTKVPVAGARNHSVNHIDIGISGDSSVTVPLAFGTYYYVDESGNMQEYTVTSSTSVDLSLKNVVITPEDMKHATIKAYDKNNDELHDVFDVTGYSSNAHTENSNVQVRIEGNFKVADLDYTIPYQNSSEPYWNDSFTDNNGYHNVKNDRLQNPITYVVSATKNLTFPIKDDAHGQLYEQMADGSYRALSINLDVDMTASFNYFDQRNECPPLWKYNNSYSTPNHGDEASSQVSSFYEIWQSGGFPWEYNTGMDFVLGGNAEKANADIVAIEITKLIVDENGQLIKPAEKIVNNMIIHELPGALENNRANSVMSLNLEKYNDQTYNDYDSYTKQHNKAIAVGNSGVGLVYDYSVHPGLVYVEEDKNTLTNHFKDVDDTNWYYKQTYITTEYVRRGGANGAYDDKAQHPDPMHYSKTYTTDDAQHYNSIPEVLGVFELPEGYGTKKSGFVEFFVYNVYENDHTKLEVEKEWNLPEGVTVPADTEVTMALYYAKRVHNDESTEAWSDEYDNPEIYKPVKGAAGFKAKLNTSITLKANSVDASQNWKGVFTDLPTTITVDGVVYDVHYCVKEITVKVNGVDVTDHYQSIITRTDSSDPKVDGKVTVTNKSGDLEIIKKWYDKNGYPYTPAGSDNNVVITAELWKRGTENLAPVTVTIRAKTDSETDYSELWSSQVKSGSSVQFSVGVNGTSDIIDPVKATTTVSPDKSLKKLSSREVIYNNGKTKTNGNVFELSDITTDTTISISFKDNLVKADGIGYCIIGINEGLPYDAKVPDDDPVNTGVEGIANGVITLNSDNGWHISIPAGKMSPRYYYFINADTVRETGTGGRYAFAGPIIDMDSNGNKIISFENKLLKEYVSLDVEKIWSPAGTAPAGAAVTVELYYATRSKGSNGDWSEELPVKDNPLFESDEVITELTLSADNQWKGTIGDLPKYLNNETLEVDYRVREIKVTVDGEDVTGRYTNTGNVTVEKVAPEGNNAISNGTAKVTNTNETVTVSVNKLWQPDPPEGASVTVELHRYAKKTKGSVILTLNSDKGAPIRGAVFELYKDNAPYTHHGVPSYTTDANGQISITGLDVGSYELRQVSTPTGYSYSGTVAGSFSIIETTANQTKEIFLTNTATGESGVFTLTLLDKVTHLPVQDASFKLVQDGTVLVSTYLTNANGTITVDNLGTGVYQFEETAPAPGYKTAELASGNSATFEVQEAHGNQSGSVTMLCEKQAKGKVTLKLTNTSGQPVSGAAFKLSNGDTVYTTKSDGQIVVENLPAGTYSFTQTAVPSGNQYDLYTGDMSFIVPDNGRWDNEATIDVTEPDKTGNVTIRLWRKQGIDAEWNWEEFVGSRGIRLVPGNTYRLTAQLNASMYPDHFWFYFEESSDDFTGDSGHTMTGTLTPLYEKVTAGQGTWDNGTYTFEFTPNTDNTTYNFAIVTDWDIGGIVSFSLEAVVQTPTLSMSPSGTRGRKLSAPKMMSSGLRGTGEPSIVGENTSPASAPDGYMDDSTFTPISVTLSGSNWSHTFDPQEKYDPDGNPYYYYVVETKRTPSYYWVESYANDKLTADGTITITNKNRAELTINKTVAGAPTTNATFTFTVTGAGLPDGGRSFTKYWPADFSGGSMAPITLTETDGIRPGEIYTVTETATGATGYTRTTTVSSSSGQTDGSVTINSTTHTGSINFTNSYEHQTVDVPVEKKWVFVDESLVPRTAVTGGEWPDGVEVTVTLFKRVGSGDPVTTDQTRTLTAANTSDTFTNLPKYQGENLITYSVQESGISGVDSSRFTSQITGNMTSGFTITNNEKPGSLTVMKSLNVPNASGESLTFYVGLFTRSGEEGSYTYALATPADVGGTNPQAITIANGGTSNTASFQNLVIGTQYYVFETKQDGTRVTAADKTSGYSIAASQVDGVPVTIAETTAASITNNYTATGTVPFKAKKILTGDDLDEGQFIFTLTEYESDFSTVKAGGVSQTVTNGGTGIAVGDVVFTDVPLAMSEVGTSRYFVIKETAGSDNSIEYDGTEQHITVSVTDDGQGHLRYTKIPAADANGYDATFTNVKKGSLQITKQFLTGSVSDGADRDFTFRVRLWNHDDSPFEGTIVLTDTEHPNGHSINVQPLNYWLDLPGTNYDNDADYNNIDNWELRSIIDNVTIHGAGNATISNLPAGTKYQVSELGPTANDQTNWGAWSIDPQSGSIVAGQQVTVTAINTRKGILRVQKLLKDTGNNSISISPAPSFPITITTEIGGTTYYVQNTSGELDTTAPAPSLEVTAETSLDIYNLPYGTYTVTETNPDSVEVTGYEFVGVTVTSNNAPSSGTGTVTIDGDHNNPTVDITNTYNVPIYVTKSFSGVESLPDNFKITAEWTENGVGYTYDLPMTTPVTSPISGITNGVNTSTATIYGPDTTVQGINYKWTLYLPVGTEVAFTEYNGAIAGKHWSATVTDGAGTTSSYVGGVDNSGNPASGSGTASATPQTVAFNNTYEPLSLTLKKAVEASTNIPVSGNIQYTDGTFTFTVSGLNGFSKTVIITLENGEMTGATVDGTPVRNAANTDENDQTVYAVNAVFDSTNGVTFTNLATDTYTVTEGEWTPADGITRPAGMGMYLDEIEVTAGSGTTELSTSSVSLNVISASPSVTFTNILEPNTATVDKMVADINDTTANTGSSVSSMEHVWNYSADHDVGDPVPFRITVNIPSRAYRDTNGAYAVTIHDVMENMTYIEGTGKMYAFVKSDAPGEGETGDWYDVTEFFNLPSAGVSTFDVTLKDGNLKDVSNDKQVSNWGESNTHQNNYPVNTPVTTSTGTNFDALDIRMLQFRYKATLTNTAIIGQTGNLNTATVTSTGGVEQRSSNKVFTYKLVVKKTDKDDNELSGATFQLYKAYLLSEFVPSAVKDDPVTLTSGSIKIHGHNLPSDVDLSEIQLASGEFYYVGDATVSGSTFTWNRIDDGSYILIETHAPDNFTRISKAIRVTIDVDHAQDDRTLPGITSDSINLYPENIVTRFFGETIDLTTFKNKLECLKIPNHQGSLSITKAVTTGSNAADTDFTFNVTLTPPTGATLDPTTFTVTGDTETTVKSSSFTKDNNTGIVTGTVVITGTGTATIKGFPEGTVYTVEEVVPDGWKLNETVYSNAGTTSEGVTTRTITNDVTDTVTFTNEELCSITVDKKWFNGNTEVTDTIQNASVTVELRADGTAVTLDAFGNTIVAQQTLPITTTDESTSEQTTTWAYTWSNLPKYDANGDEIVYTVVETSAKVETNKAGGGTDLTPLPTATGTMAEGFHLVNTLPTVDIPVKKTWGNNETWLDSYLSVEMTLKANGTSLTDAQMPAYITTVHDAETNEDTEQSIPQTAAIWLTSADAATGKTWHNLPKYDNTGAEITYTVVETDMKYDGNVITNWREAFTTTPPTLTDGVFIIDNTPEETSIQVTKVWTLNGTARTDKNSIGFTVHKLVGTTDTILTSVWTSVGDETATENSNPTVAYQNNVWQTVTISKLPKYEMKVETTTEGETTTTTVSYVPINYYVVETGEHGTTQVTYSLPPTSGTEGQETATAADAKTNDGKITIYNRDASVNIVIVKIDETTRNAAEHTKLPGAVFQLYKGTPETNDEGQQSISWNAQGEAQTTSSASGSEGTLTFSALTEGRYKIVETQAPAGYNNLTGAIYFTISVDGGVIWTDESGNTITTTTQAMIEYKSTDKTFVVGNTPGVELPATGGPGTAVYTVTGLTLTLGAALWLLFRRKRRTN